jgi:ketosteroid isomerase-like protein
MSAGKATSAVLLASVVILGPNTGNAQQSSDLEAIAATHEAFHTAFGKEDIDLMSEVWLHGPSVRLIVPPSDKVLAGWEEIKGSFEGTFEALEVLSLSTQDVYTMMGQEFAWIVDVHGLEMRTGDGQVIKPEFFSTHIFQKVGDRWLMVHHQASAPPASGE